LPHAIAKDTTFTTYLAGPITGRSDAECKDWRRWADAHLVCLTADPMARDFRGREQEPGVAAEIVEGDKADIVASDAVLVHVDRPSVGTSMEVLFAWQIGKYVVIANVSGAPLSPWLLYHSHAQATSLADAVELVNARVLARRTGGR
jgi:nucleoside 2-deoxyribosyltransferase